MMGLLQCGGCASMMDLGDRRPKMLPCGHTVCQACVTASWTERRDNAFACPTDSEVFHVDPACLRDDLQLVCWLDALAEGLVECVRCERRFERVWRRPVALGCGHSVCRECLHEANKAVVVDSHRQQQHHHHHLADARDLRGSRLASLDWDYSEEEEDVFGVVRSKAPRAAREVVACPIKGCGTRVTAVDHLHLLSCLDGEPVSRRASQQDLQVQVLDKLSSLENHLVSLTSVVNVVQVLGPTIQPRSLPARNEVDITKFASLDSVAAKKRKRDDDILKQNEQSSTHQFCEADVSNLIALLQELIDHKDSPRSELPGVFKKFQDSANSLLPGLQQFEKNQVSIIPKWNREDVTAITGLKESMVLLNVSDLSLYGPHDMRVKKEALLRSDKRVYKLTGVDCWSDPDWTLRLLTWVAPHVEELHLRFPTRQHLLVVRDAMPFLRRLDVRGWNGYDLQENPFCFSENRDTLEWLEVHLPQATALSLMRAHQRSLRKVRLMVGDDWQEDHEAAADGSDSGFSSDDNEASSSSGDDHPHQTSGVDDVDEGSFVVVPFGEDCVQKLGCWDALRSLPRLLRDMQCLASVTLLWLSPRLHDCWHCVRLGRLLSTANPSLSYECEACRPSLN